MVVSDRRAGEFSTVRQACDRGRFERAWRLHLGDFFEGFSPGGCPQFDEWTCFRREALRGRLIQALERVVYDKKGPATTRRRPRSLAAKSTSCAISCSPLVAKTLPAERRRNVAGGGTTADALRHLC